MSAPTQATLMAPAALDALRTAENVIQLALALNASLDTSVRMGTASHAWQGAIVVSKPTSAPSARLTTTRKTILASSVLMDAVAVRTMSHATFVRNFIRRRVPQLLVPTAVAA